MGNELVGRAARRTRRGAMRMSDVGVLVAVGAVVLLVSLPRLRAFALRENETDARNLVERLGRMIERDVRAAEPSALGSRDAIEQWIKSDAAFARQLDDAEFLAGGTLLRRHGYLFDVVGGAGPVVRAWPWSYRKTGFAAFAWAGERRLVAHDNADGEWSGPDSAPPAACADWRDLLESR